jgi:hypothetical protein
VPVASADCVETLGSRTVNLNDDPVYVELHNKVSERYIEWDIIVKNPTCCGCNDSKTEVQARQDLKSNPGEPPTIGTQKFTYPYSTTLK